jgi:hypothetical protein
VVLWLRCRGKFIFLDNVFHDRAEIAEPWRNYKEQGNSLFLWMIGYGLVGLAVFAVVAVVAAFSLAVPFVQHRVFAGLGPTLAANVVVWVVVGGIFAYIGRFLEDFVIPLMYKDRLRATAAWARFFDLMGAQTLRFVGYGLFYLLLYFCAVALLLLFVVVTCCVAGCLMMLPYVGTVVILPMLVFFRCFSLEYLAQFDPGFRMKDIPLP